MKKILSLAIVIGALTAAGCATDNNNNAGVTTNQPSANVNTAAKETGEAANTAGGAISDASITTKIKAKFLADGIVGTNVDTVNGEVTLKGAVDDAKEKTKAEQIARDTEGVKSVKNELTIEKK